MLSEVPEGWGESALQELCYRPISYGVLKPGDYAKDGRPMLRIQDVKTNFEPSLIWRISSELDEEYRRTRLNEGDIVFSVVGTLGEVKEIDSKLAGANISRAFAVIGADKEKICLSYLLQFLKGSQLSDWVAQTGRGGAQKVVNLGELRALSVPLPPLNEQHRIAEILSSVDASIQVTQAVIEQAERVKRGLVRERILGGLTPEEIFEGEAPENSELKTIAQATENLNKRRIPIKKSERQSGEYPYYGATGVIDYVKDYIFDERILLISEDGANLVDRNYPIAYSVEGKTWVNNHAHVLKVDSPAQQKLIEEFFNEVPLTKFLTGMAQPKLNKAALGTIPVPVFSEAEAVVLAEAIAALDASIASNRASIAQLQTVKSGLMDDLLSGKVRTV